VLGVLVALVGGGGMLYGYAAVLVALPPRGWRTSTKWTYDYGHNLDPKAIIKVPG
jgi:hypothetical protein